MTFDVDVGSRRRRVELRRTGADWTVRIDGRLMLVSLAATPAGWSMLVRTDEAGSDAEAPRWSRGARSHQIAIERRQNGARLVTVDGHAVALSLLDARARLARGTAGTSGKTSGRATVTAPMPGRVVKVLVAPGDPVTARQGLVVVEAMKMENELRAPRAGRVAEVRVAEGATVEAGTLLVVLH